MAEKKNIKVLFLGDLIGRPGRRWVAENLATWRKTFAADLVIANGENSAAGFGITKKIYDELTGLGIDVITGGNHIWDKKEFLKVIDDCPALVRPANYPPGAPGQGWLTVKLASGQKVTVLNLLGRVFVDDVDCPFRRADEVLEEVRKISPFIIVDIHAEATSEKIALGWYLDGRVSAVLGTHTHVQTADDRVLPAGTAFISDIGMVGPRDSVIGVVKETIIHKFLTRLPERYEPAPGPVLANAVFLEIDGTTGQTVRFERLSEVRELTGGNERETESCG